MCSRHCACQPGTVHITTLSFVFGLLLLAQKIAVEIFDLCLFLLILSLFRFCLHGYGLCHARVPSSFALRWTARYSLCRRARSVLLVEGCVRVQSYLHFPVEEARCWVVGGRRQIIIANAEETAVLEKRQVAQIVFELEQAADGVAYLRTAAVLARYGRPSWR